MKRKKILVRCPNWVGDVVMATPSLRALRAARPEDEIHVLLKKPFRDLLARWPVLDGVIDLPSADLRSLSGIRRTARRLEDHAFDEALLLTNSFGTALEVYLAHIPVRIGYAGDFRSWMLTDAVRGRPRVLRDDPRPMADLYLDLAARLGAAKTDRRYELAVAPDEENAALAWFDRHGIDPERPIAGLNPGANFGASKLWDPLRFAAAGDRLVRDFGMQVVILGAPSEKDLLGAISASMREPHVDSSADIVPLGPLKALIRRLAVLVTTDTGPRAIAQAFNVPTVVVMGPTHPGWTAVNNELAVICRHDVPCGPCHKKNCPLDHACMTLITVDEVVAAASRWARR